MKPPRGILANRTHPLSRNLEGSWVFNEGTGSQASDTSGNGRHGTLTSMDPATDWVGTPQGGGLAFDGSDDYVDTGDFSNGFDYITVATWIKPEATSRGDFIAKWSSGDYQYNLLQGVSTGLFQFYASTNGGSATGSGNSTTSITTGEWYFVAGTYDGSDVKVFVNGIEENSAALSGTLYDSSTQNNLIGKSNDAFWVGDIGSVQMYDRALTSAEIRQLYLDSFQAYRDRSPAGWLQSVAAGGRIMSSLTNYGGLAGKGGIAGQGGGLAG